MERASISDDEAVSENQNTHKKNDLILKLYAERSQSEVTPYPIFYHLLSLYLSLSILFGFQALGFFLLLTNSHLFSLSPTHNRLCKVGSFSI
jgi:hypothetical protein